jgi:hypothetical protein
MGSDNLDAIEIGNEPDLYPGQNIEKPDHGVKDYVREWRRFADLIENKVELPKGPIFQALTYSPHNRNDWSA